MARPGEGGEARRGDGSVSVAPRCRRRRSTLRLRAGVWVLAGCLVAAGAGTVSAQETPPLRVGPGEQFGSIQEAVDAAAAGQRVEVYGGLYSGPLTIRTPVILEGVGHPVIAGTGEGGIVSVQAPGVTVRGFVIRGSGSDLAAEDAGLVAQDAAGVAILENRFEDVLFGIYLKNAPGARVEGNVIHAKPLPQPRRGDGIRLWYSAGSRIERNEVTGSRDVILWFSPESVIRSNRISQGRYGIHLMYNDRTLIEGNRLAGNSVGAFLMYSRDVVVRGNLFLENRGPSGYGMGAKDVDELELRENLFIGNRVGLYLDNSPRLGSPSLNRIQGNLLAYNDVGLSAQPSVRNNLIQANTFFDNVQQVSARGGGTLGGNRWWDQGQGNYWSDYVGYDAGNDGVGDLAYRPSSLFESLLDRKPELRLFLFSPVQQAVEVASRAFPLMPAPPRLVDEAPLMAPVLPDSDLLELALGHGHPSPAVGGLALSSALAAGLLLTWTLAGGGRARSRGRFVPRPSTRPAAPPGPTEPAAMVEVSGLVKRYGRNRVLDGVDLRINRGESVALWGENGAGKTTLLKCLLGLVSCSGSVRVAGQEVSRAGPAARALVGYVPQDVRLDSDWTVGECLAFFARIRRLPPSRATEELSQAGLAPFAGRRVGELSGGMRQRLALAAALLADPPLLLLDEPSANLDEAARAAFQERLRDLRLRGKTLLFTTHRAEEAAALAERVLVLRDGRLLESRADLRAEAPVPPEPAHGAPGPDPLAPSTARREPPWIPVP